MNSKKNNSTTTSLPPTTGENLSTPVDQTKPETTPEPSLEVSKGGKTRRVEKYGSRRKVWNGTAEKTKGGLRKEDLVKNNYGRIVSAKRHTTMKKRHSA